MIRIGFYLKKDSEEQSSVNIFFRCDASQTIGIGHVMRCLVLANSLTQQGAKCIFLTKAETLSVVPDIKRCGYETILPEHLMEVNPDFMVVDHYDLGHDFFSTLNKNRVPCMIIDDTHERPFYPCELLLVNNLSFDEESYKNLVPKGCRIFSGAEFILINRHFLTFFENRRQIKTPAETLFLFFGGTDPAQLTLRLLNIIYKYKMSVPTIEVVIGEGNAGRDKIKALCLLLKATLYIQVDNMAEIMARADLAVGCGGTAIWERLSLGIPTLEMSHSEWQIPTFKKLHKQKNLYYLGCENALSDKEIASSLTKALTEGLTIQSCACGGGEKIMAQEIVKLAQAAQIIRIQEA